MRPATAAREFKFDSGRARYLWQDYDTNHDPNEPANSSEPFYWTAAGPAHYTDYDGDTPYLDGTLSGPDEAKSNLAQDRRDGATAPWPVRRGGLTPALYARSLSWAFLLLFVGCFALHVVSGARHFSEELARDGRPGVTSLEYLGTSRLWFESLQNWQSECLAVAAMVFLAVYLRERGSPESKRVDSPHEAHE